jgi:hypothetical protein
MLLIEKYLGTGKGYSNVLNVLNKIIKNIGNIKMDASQIVSLESSTNDLLRKLKNMKSTIKSTNTDLSKAGSSIEKRLSRGAR